MKAHSPYRLLAAAVLLLLYLFIATPVHWWHQHQEVVGSMIGKATDQATDNALDQHQGDSYSTVCKICSHHYSVYAPSESFTYPVVVTNYPIHQAGYIIRPQAVFVQLYSNKGPPALSFS